MRTRRFAVERIHCQGCQRTINRALAGRGGIESVDPDQTTDVVTIVYDEARISDDVIRELLADAGFPVQRVTDGAADRTEQRGAAGRYGLLAAAVLAIALAGYAGYVLYPRFDLPAVQGAGLLGLAAAAGIASFFSPCSFPLLLGLLGRQAVRRSGDGEDTARPAVFGGALALGAAVFMVLAGVVIGLGGEALFAGVTFTSTAGITIRTVVGLLLILLGLMQTGRLPLSMHAVEEAARPLARRSAALRREHPVAGFVTFGFGYVLAGFG
ncbi:MAG: heavy-metal-associated domain-containing protein [Actinobacteria bacterium]|nr:heavy-metal-associated domain-containing protein [Actinomycetota bacterium]